MYEVQKLKRLKQMAAHLNIMERSQWSRKERVVQLYGQIQHVLTVHDKESLAPLMPSDESLELALKIADYDGDFYDQLVAKSELLLISEDFPHLADIAYCGGMQQLDSIIDDWDTQADHLFKKYSNLRNVNTGYAAIVEGTHRRFPPSHATWWCLGLLVRFIRSVPVDHLRQVEEPRIERYIEYLKLHPGVFDQFVQQMWT